MSISGHSSPGGAADDISGGGVAIDALHYMVHQGFVFHISHTIAALANTASHEILVKVPASTYPHLHKHVTYVGAGDVDLDIFEGTTVSADGTAITSHITNRNSSNTPGTLFYHTPTVTDDGTLIHDQWVPPTSSGTGGSHDGADASTGEEWLLAPSTNYLIRITNNSGDTIRVWEEILWYEIGATP